MTYRGTREKEKEMFVDENNIINQKNLCSPMFIVPLFTTAKCWEQPKCPSVNEWIKNWYIYTMEYYSAERKNS